ncbi:hypothetical protein [Rhizobium ruizarguesonis]|nr:hypothetical protein [Rhizobium ruizarguesonis]WSH03112.1 hypothetical protein U8P71_09730 [Rhizobium ruizarguesonis]
MQVSITRKAVKEALVRSRPERLLVKVAISATARYDIDRRDLSPTEQKRVKNLHEEVRFFVWAWLAVAPPCAAWFAGMIVYIKINHIDPSTVADASFLWPVMLFVFMTMLLVVELGSQSKFRTGFFTAWLQMAMREVTLEGLYERGRRDS